MERLGLGPAPCLERNPRLVYARMTGWGQDGPLASSAGHDLNFAAVSGVLGACRRHGGALLSFAVACSLLEVGRSGRGQVIDAAMAEGAVLLGQALFNFEGLKATDSLAWQLVNSSAPFYDVYQCRDDGWISVAPMEPAFYATFLRVLSLEGDPEFAAQHDTTKWAHMRARLTEIFASEDRQHWETQIHGTDACISPVLGLEEAPQQPQARARKAFFEAGGITQPAPAPRFSLTPGRVQSVPPLTGKHTLRLLAEAGVDPIEIEYLVGTDVVSLPRS